MAASSHALGVATPSLTKWMLTSGGSSTSNCCSAICIPAAPVPAAVPRMRLSCSSSGGVRSHSVQTRHATAVDGEVSTAASQSAGSLVVLEELQTEAEAEAEVEVEAEPSQQQPAQPRQRNIRRAKRGGGAILKAEDLTEGAVFPGSVRTVTNYGAFVDIGAFTDGLVHISQLSDSYVAQVQDLVSVGQQVSVRILEVDFTTGRISLSMRPPASSAPAAETAAASGSGTPRVPGDRRKIAGRGTSKSGTGSGSGASSKPSVQKGQTITGVIKNVTKTALFLTLSTGDEGILRAVDMSIPNPTGLTLESLVQVGQELEVRVQRIDGRGRVTLTQKREVDLKSLNLAINNNEEAGAVNPFELAFRQSNLLTANFGVTAATEEADDVVGEVVEETVPVPEAASKEDAENVGKEDEAPVSEAVVEEVIEGKTLEPTLAVPDASKDEEQLGEDVKEEPQKLEEQAETVAKGLVEEVIVEEASIPEATKEDLVAEEPPLPGAQALVEYVAVEEHLSEAVVPEPAESEAEAQKSDEVEESSMPVAQALVADVIEETTGQEGDQSQAVEEPPEPEEVVEEPVTEAATPEEPQEVEKPSLENEGVVSPVPVAQTEAQEIGEEVIGSSVVQVGEETAALEESTTTLGGEEAPVVLAESVEVASIVEETPGSAVEAVSPVEAVTEVEAEKVEDEPAVPVTEAAEAGVEEVVAEAGNVEDTSAVPNEEAQKVDEAAVPDTEPGTGVEAVLVAEAQSVKDIPEAENVEEVVAEVQGPPAEAPSSPVPEADNVEQPPPEVKPSPPPVSEAPTVAAAAAVLVSPALVKELRQLSGAGMMDCKKALVACANDLEKASEYLRKKGLASADKKASRVAAEGLIGSYIHDGRIGVLIEVNSETDFVARGDRFKELVQDLAMQVAAYPQVLYVSVEDIPAEIADAERKIESAKEDLANKPEAVRSKIVDGRVNKILKELSLLDQPYIRNDKLLVQDHIKETIAALGEKLQVRRFQRFNLGEGIEKKKTDFAAEVAEQTKPKEAKAEAPKKAPEPEQNEIAPAVVVSAAAVKDLRQATGAGMMDCKKALAACGNDLERATEYLRTKGLASAEKKASRVAAEGIIGKYIHDGRIGVLIEVNCETDFVARGERFKDLVQDLAMQVVASPQVSVVSVDDVPAEVVAKERELESQRDDILSKPEAVRSRILDGRIAKRLAELALLEQPYVRNDKILVKDHIKETIAALGENIQVRRYVKFVLGEGIEKKKADFAAEVAAQTQVMRS